MYIVGIGPGELGYLSQKAFCVLRSCEVVIGYKAYVRLLGDLIQGKEIIASSMGKELVRAEAAIEQALSGRKVALISSGDSGIYGMAGVVLEIVEKESIDLDLEIIPGIPAFCAAASSLGAPIMNDFALISLSDLLTPWEIIERRLTCACQGDFVIVLYNPKSKKRTWQISKTQALLLKYKSGQTPVGIVRNARRGKEKVILTTLDRMLDYSIDMLTTIIVGNSSTSLSDRYMVTPRGYKIGVDSKLRIRNRPIIGGHWFQ